MHGNLSEVARKLLDQMFGCHADAFGREFVLFGRMREAHDEAFEASRQVEVEQLRVRRVDGEGVLAVARHRREGARARGNRLPASLEGAMATDHVKPFVGRVHVGGRPAAIWGNELVDHAKTVPGIDPGGHDAPEVAQLPEAGCRVGEGMKSGGVAKGLSHSSNLAARPGIVSILFAALLFTTT